MNETSRKLRGLGYSSAYIANYLNIRYQDYCAIREGNATKANFNIVEKTRELITNKNMFLANQSKMILEAKAVTFSGTLYEKVNKINMEIIKSYTGWTESTIRLNLYRIRMSMHKNELVDIRPNELLVFYNIFKHHGSFNYVQRTDNESAQQKIHRKVVNGRIQYKRIKFEDLTKEEQKWYLSFNFKDYVTNYNLKKPILDNLETILTDLGFTMGYSGTWYELSKHSKTSANYILIKALYAYVNNLPKVDVKLEKSDNEEVKLEKSTKEETINKVDQEINTENIELKIDSIDKEIENKKKEIKSLKYQIALETNKQLDKEISKLASELNRLRYGTEEQPDYARDTLPE